MAKRAANNSRRQAHRIISFAESGAFLTFKKVFWQIETIFQFKLFGVGIALLFAYLHRLVRIWFCSDALLLLAVSVHRFADFSKLCSKCRRKCVFLGSQSSLHFRNSWSLPITWFRIDLLIQAILVLSDSGLYELVLLRFEIFKCLPNSIRIQ